MAQNMRIFKRAETKKAKKSKDNQYKGVKTNVYYWASISDKDQHGEWLTANIMVRMSKAAAELFEEVSEETKNPEVTSAFVRVQDCWLKAVPGKDHNNVVLFVNDFDPIDGFEDKDFGEKD